MRQVVLALGIVTATCVQGAERKSVVFKPIPVPVEFVSDMTKPISFSAGDVVRVDAGEATAEGVAWLNRRFFEWYADKAPRAVAGSVDLTLKAGDEAYAASADAQGVRIKARTLAGVRWAAYSIRQVAIARRGTMKTAGQIVPTFTMSDAPHMAFRGIHLCWFREVRPQQIERCIRMAALMKFNYAVIEPWGMYRSAKHPWWGWADGTMTKQECRRLTALGKELGITLCPQINVFGHGSSARSVAMKHAILDFSPEYEPLFEPGGWNWCLTNPETQRILRELIDEMCEDFDNPPYFHLGCDEAQPPSCPECLKHSYGELVSHHIADLAAYVKSRHNARAMMWHDMMLKQGDARWKGFVATGNDDTVKLADLLPKDVIICDWQYSYGNMKEVRKDWPTIAYFKEKGFPVCACPWMNFNAMRPMADFVVAKGAFGYLQTTWHRLFGDPWVKMFRYGSSAAWGSSVEGPASQFDSVFGNVLKMIGRDMKVSDPSDTGVYNDQVPARFSTM